MSDYRSAMSNRSERVLAAIKDVFSNTRIYKPTGDALNDALDAKVYGTKDFARLNPYYRGVMRGYIDACMDVIWSQVHWYHVDPSSMIAYPHEPFPKLDYRRITEERWFAGHAWEAIAEPTPAHKLHWFTPLTRYGE